MGRISLTAAEKETMSRIMKAANRRAGNGGAEKDGRSTPTAKARDRKTAKREPRSGGRFR